MVNIPPEIDAKLYTLEDALTACFGGFTRRDDGHLFVECCGKVTYGSGVLGPDIARCVACCRAVVLAYSPHVSPLLIDGCTATIPSNEFVETLGERCWLVCEPTEQPS